MQPQFSEPLQPQQSNFYDRFNNAVTIQSPQLIKQDQNIEELPQNNEVKQKFVHRTKNMKTEQQYLNQKQTKNSLQKQKTKCSQRKLHATTYRSGLMKSIHNSSQLILVYLMYKQHKLSLFINKGVSFELLVKKMYKQIYIYEKQTYSISNAILKNLLYRITGFESIDNDIVYDYELKYKRGTLQKQKFFVPFRWQDHKTPFKIYTRIASNLYGGNQFLARNYSDSQWVIVTTIKKSSMDQQNINAIKKSLKNNTMACSLLLKNNSTSFSQINWLQTKHYLIIVSQYLCQTLEENLAKGILNYDKQSCQSIFIYYAKWLAYVLKQTTASNIPHFKKLTLNNIGLNPSDGQPKISILDNVVNCLDFAQKRRSVITYGKRVSQKIQDLYYYQTYLNLIKSLQAHLNKRKQTNQLFNSFTNFLQDQTTLINFSFDSVFRYLSQSDPSATCACFQKQKNNHPLKVNFTSKLIQIVAKIETQKNNPSSANKQTILISEVNEEVHKLFSLQNIRKNQQRNEANSILQMLSTTSGFGDLKKQNIGNVTEFKKQEERKYQMKTKQRIYVQQILNELNQNQNFIKTTKKNNLASIEFYLKKSDEKIKKKMVEKIQTKYKKFFEKKQNNLNCEILKGNMSQISMNHNYQIEDLDETTHEKTQKLFNMTSTSGKTPKPSLTNYGIDRKTNNYNMGSSLIQKENFSTNILSRLEQRNTTTSKKVHLSLKPTQKDFMSPETYKRRGKLEELLINRKNYSKEEKLVLKKKQYGIYLDEAEKQYNKIRLYRKNTAQNFPK